MTAEPKPTTDAAAPPRRGVIDRVFASYGDLRGEMKRLLADRPSEATLLSFVMIFALISFVGGAMELFAAPRDFSDEEALNSFRGDLFARFIGAFFIATLGVYLIAALATPALRAFGGTGGGYETRAALAWSLLTASPLLLLSDAMDAAAVAYGGLDAISGAALRAPAEAPVLFAVAMLANAGALYIAGVCLAAAHGYRSASGLLGVLLGFTLIVALITLALGLRSL
ncbi:MAG: YIP1 family protein [Pseudomonadota bacterium]